jgi:hypothetical protein
MKNQKQVVPDLGPALGYDENFGGVDLSGCPSVRALPEDESPWIDERFGSLVNESNGAAKLRQFIEEQQHEGPSALHVGNDEFEITIADGTWHANATIGKNAVHFTACTRDELVGKLMEFAKQRSAPRELTEAERLRVARMCQAGDKDGAIDFYLLKRLGSARVHRYKGNEIRMVSDPELQDILDECAYVTWLYSCPNVTESDEWFDFLPRYVNGRPLNHDLLNSAWSAFTEQNFRSTLLPKAKETDPRKIVRELDSLSDSEIEQTYAETVRHVATARR